MELSFVSEHQISVNNVENTSGEQSTAEMISELMGLLVACGLMIGAIVGVMVIQIGFRDAYEGTNDILVGALWGGAIGALISWIGVWAAEKYAAKSTR
jgi:hypothetical protein